MTGPPGTELLERSRTEIAERPRVRRGRRLVAVILLTVGLVVTATGAVSVLRGASVPSVREVVIASETTAALEVDYADAPSFELVAYEHGSEVSYAIQLRNDGPLPVTVEDVPIAGLAEDLRLIRPTAVLVLPEGGSPEDGLDAARPFERFRLARGATRTVVVTGVFDNCEYYTERAMDLVTSQPVTWSVAGWSTTTDLELSRQLAIRSPYLRVCPGRVMDRGARSRTGLGTL